MPVMSPMERQGMVYRLINSTSILMDQAKKTHGEGLVEQTTEEEKNNYITRLSTNEFFFYTQEPLTLKEFE